jgi:bla regulator protein BlaR1
MDANPLAHDLFLRVLMVSGQASLLALLIVALQRVLRGHLSPGWRHALWGLLLVRLLLLWSVPASWSLSTLAQHAWTSLLPAAAAPVLMPQSVSATLPDLANPAFSLMPWAVAVWCFGAAVTLGLAVLQACRLGMHTRRRVRVTDPEVLALLADCRRRMGIRRDVPILGGPEGSAPALLGFLRPRLLIPAELLAPEARVRLRCVLLHELAHIRRADVLTGWTAHVVLSLHWFNPVLWWARRRCTEDRELACDARVLVLLAPRERRGYGHALLDQIKTASPSLSSPGLVGVLDGSSSIERRIEMITAFDPSRRRHSIPAQLAVLLLALTALTGAEEGVQPAQAVIAVAPVVAVAKTSVLPAVEAPQPVEAPAASAAAPVDSVASTVPAAAEAPSAALAAASLPAKQAAPARTKVAKAAKNRTTPANAPVAPVAELQNVDVRAPHTPAATVPEAPMDPQAAPATGSKPATLHHAINRAAEDYAQSLEAKSTRPGEDPPFTLTVGGSVQVRAQYWSDMPNKGARGLPRGGAFTPEMRTRLKLSADFGQVQAVAEGSVYER